MRARFAMAAVGLALAFGGAPWLAGCGGAQVHTERRVLAPADPRAVREFVQGVRLLQRGSGATDRAAAAHFRKAIALDPDLWEAQYDLGVLLRRHGRLHKAVVRFESAHKIQPGSHRVLLALAEARYSLGDRRGASDLLRELVKQAPDEIDARVALATVLRQEGEYDDALAQAREVLIRNPSDTAALAEVGRVYLAKKRYDVAELVFKKALALVGDGDTHMVARIHDDLGLLELARGDTQLAFQHFGKAIEVDPGFVPARMNQGAVLLKAGDYDGARQQYQAVVAADPNRLEAHVALGAAYRGLGHNNKAKQEYELVLRKQPDEPAALFNLAILRAEFLNQRPQARPLFQKFLQVASGSDPHRKVAQQYLAEIPAPAPAHSGGKKK